MDPVSQTQASEALAGRGYSIVGWYHSHPAFDPNPSLRDIDTQAKYQVQNQPRFRMKNTSHGLRFNGRD